MESTVAPPLALLFDQWLAARRPHQGEQRASNARWWAKAALAALDGLGVHDLTEERIGGLFQARLKAGVAGTTLNTERAFLASFFRWAQKQGLVMWSPMEAWPRQPEDVQRPHPALSHQEEDMLCGELSCENGEIVERFIRFLVATGLRPVSGRRCRCQDVTKERGLYLLNLPGRALKNRRGLRMCLSPAAVACLPQPLPGKGLLFPGLPGRVAFWKIVTAAARRAKLGRVTPKTFRSTWVGRMADAGGSVREIMSIQGWRRENILTAHYFPAVPHDRAAELYRRVEGR